MTLERKSGTSFSHEKTGKEQYNQPCVLERSGNVVEDGNYGSKKGN